MTIFWSGRFFPQPTKSPHAFGVRLGVDHLPAGQAGGVEGANHRRFVDVSAGDDQRGLGQSVARIKRLAAESARLEGFAKGVERFGADRFRAVEGDFPTAKDRAFFAVRA